MENLKTILYSDEQETTVVHVEDAVAPIEAYLGLKVLGVVSVSKEDVKSEVTTLRFQGKKRPDALWWFRVRCASPEGEREALLSMALFERTLQVISVDTSPQLVFFHQALRDRAKQEAPPLTREYLERLEDIVRRGYLLWKGANEYGRQLETIHFRVLVMPLYPLMHNLHPEKDKAPVPILECSPMSAPMLRSRANCRAIISLKKRF
jgi:hypothetical protein